MSKRKRPRKRPKWTFESLTLLYGRVNIPGRTDR